VEKDSFNEMAAEIDDYVVLDESSYEQYLRLHKKSVPIHFQYTHENERRTAVPQNPPITLDLFQSHHVAPAQPPPHSDPRYSAAAPPLASVLFVGGTVWAMDVLRPQHGHADGARAAARPPALLALAAHSCGAEETPVGGRIGGRSAVQVGRSPRAAIAKNSARSQYTPRDCKTPRSQTALTRLSPPLLVASSCHPLVY
jgi:hypothetical protein